MEGKDLNSRIIDMTLLEALEIAKPYLERVMAKVVRDNLEGKGEDEWGVGLNAICEVFECSKATAVEIHHKKCYQPAFCDDGKRRFSVNKTLLIKLRQEQQSERIKKGLI